MGYVWVSCSPSLENIEVKAEISIWQAGRQRPAGSLRRSHGLSIVFTLTNFLDVVSWKTSGEAGTRDLPSPLTWEQEELLGTGHPKVMEMILNCCGMFSGQT